MHSIISSGENDNLLQGTIQGVWEGRNGAVMMKVQIKKHKNFEKNITIY
jgi:hypothetical protein